jgi:hypothetical protein
MWVGLGVVAGGIAAPEAGIGVEDHLRRRTVGGVELRLRHHDLAVEIERDRARARVPQHAEGVEAAVQIEADAGEGVVAAAAILLVLAAAAGVAVQGRYVDRRRCAVLLHHVELAARRGTVARVVGAVQEESRADALPWRLLNKSNKAITLDLGMSEAAIKVQLKALLRKVRVNNRTQAAVWAFGQGLKHSA